MNIPIIILNWNGIEDTKECIDALMLQSHQAFDVYLVDNGSESEEVNQLKALYDNHEKIKLICNAENLGFARGNNEVMSTILDSDSIPPYLILLNNDTAVTTNWLASLLQAAHDADADIVASKMINYFDRTIMDNAGHTMMNTGEIIPIGSAESIETYVDSFENLGACGGAALYSTSMLKDIGIFDDFFQTGYEDAELGLRAHLLNYKTIYAPDAIVFHKVSQSIKKVFDYNFVLKSRVDVFYTFLKLMPISVLLLSIPSIFVKYFIMIIVDLIFLRFQFLKLIFHSFKEVLFTKRSFIKSRRKAFRKDRKFMSSTEILKKQHFFLWWDVKRFFKDVVFKKKPMFYK